MDLLNYIDYHYMNDDAEWVKKAKGLQPKPITEILIDLFIRIVMIMILIGVFYWGTRLMRFAWTRYNQKKNLRKFRTQMDNSGEAGAGDNVLGHHHDD